MTGGRGEPAGCRQLDPAIVSVMLTIVERQTDDALTRQFGLSYNTWRKLKAGLPIRSSLADRVEQRVRHLGATARRS